MDHAALQRIDELTECIFILISLIETEGLPDQSPVWRKALEVTENILHKPLDNTTQHNIRY